MALAIPPNFELKKRLYNNGVFLSGFIVNRLTNKVKCSINRWINTKPSKKESNLRNDEIPAKTNHKQSHNHN